MKIIKSIRIEESNLDEIKSLPCVEHVTTDPLTVRLKDGYTDGRQTATKMQFLCQFETEKWQVFGHDAEANLHYNPYC